MLTLSIDTFGLSSKDSGSQESKMEKEIRKKYNIKHNKASLPSPHLLMTAHFHMSHGQKMVIRKRKVTSESEEFSEGRSKREHRSRVILPCVLPLVRKTRRHTAESWPPSRCPQALPSLRLCTKHVCTNTHIDNQ